MTPLGSPPRSDPGRQRQPARAHACSGCLGASDTRADAFENLRLRKSSPCFTLLFHTGASNSLGPYRRMAAVGSLLGVLWQSAVKAAASRPCCLHTSAYRADSTTAALTRLHRQAYARLYPVLLVKQDGSTIHIRYQEPRRMLAMPLDLDTLSPEDRRARLRKREAQLRHEKEEEPELTDDFNVEHYRQFWIRTKK